MNQSSALEKTHEMSQGKDQLKIDLENIRPGENWKKLTKDTERSGRKHVGQ